MIVNNKPSTRSSTGSNIISTYMKKITPTKDGSTPKLSMALLQEQINAQNEIINKQSDVINHLVTKVNQQSFELQRHVSLLAVKDCVFAGLQKELHRLQQYTRRYSVVVAGVEKKRGEKPEDLLKEVESLVGKVQSTTTMNDVDKFHRNGPNYDGDQDIIIRFKSHSAKEAFYRKRKSSDDNIKIRPSLSPHNKSLLHAAQAHIKEYEDSYASMSNRPDFVLGNIHGEIQVKFKKDVGKKGMFFGFDSIEELSCLIANAQHMEQGRLTHQSKAEFDDSNSDEMGFGPL